MCAAVPMIFGLRKLPSIVNSRQKAAEKITNGIKDLDGLKVPTVFENCTHAYYVYPMLVAPNGSLKDMWLDKETKT